MSNSKFNVTISDTVYKRIHELNEEANEQQPLMLRIRVDAGGCSGFIYEYDLVMDYEPGDFIAEKDNAIVVIDSLSQNFINGAIIEYIEELGHSYFKITNPAAQAKCGCGNSFAL